MMRGLKRFFWISAARMARSLPLKARFRRVDYGYAIRPWYLRLLR
jgi:hypothetical protein